MTFAKSLVLAGAVALAPVSAIAAPLVTAPIAAIAAAPSQEIVDIGQPRHARGRSALEIRRAWFAKTVAQILEGKR